MERQFVIVEVRPSYNEFVSTSFTLRPAPEPNQFATKKSAKDRLKELPNKSSYVILPIYIK